VITFDLLHLAAMLGPGDWPNLGQASEADPILQRGLKLAYEALRRDPENQPPRAGVVVVLLRQAQLIQEEHPAEAIALNRRALAEAQTFPTEFAAYPELGTPYLYTIIAPLARVGRASEAKEFFERAKAFLEPRLAKNPADLYAAYHLAGCWMHWADAQGSGVEARSASVNAERVIQAAVEAAPSDFLLAWRLGHVLERRHKWLAPSERSANKARVVELRKEWLDRYPKSGFHRREFERAIALEATP
jgi:hypothetical protein